MSFKSCLFIVLYKQQFVSVRIQWRRMIGRTWFGSFLVCTINHSELFIKNPNKSAQPYKSSNTLKRQNQILSGTWKHFHLHEQ